MANVLYDKAREKFLTAGINWSADTIKAVLVDAADYTFSQSHEFLSDIIVGGRVATSGALAGKTVVGGVADASDVTIATVSGDQAEALVIYKDTGSAATSPLIAYIDTATGLPITPNGGDISIVWDNGTTKIFKI